jgi:3-deoxy-7-phosphoheptulonate synthase
MHDAIPQTPGTRPVQVGPILLGGPAFAVIAGPCAVESRDRFEATALAVRAAGAVGLRGGIYKLRTSPGSFQGLGSQGLELARAVRDVVGLPLVSEIVDPRHIEALGDVVDMFQVGTRNMFNYSLLKELGRAGKPVLLKRGFAARMKEWLLAADYVIQGGNADVVLCERGIRTFDTFTRNTLDLGAVAYVKQNTPFPILVDPSHAAGRRDLVEPLALAAVAAGADGRLVEVHESPAEALSDAAQTLDIPGFRRLMNRLERVLEAVNRPLHTLP